MSKKALKEEKDRCQRKIRELERRLSLADGLYQDHKLRWQQAEGEVTSLLKKLHHYERTRVVKTVTYNPLPRRSLGPATGILCASDWHVEEKCDPQNVNNLNTYNPTIADRRINQFWKKSLFLLNDCRHASNIRDLVVWFGGDFITGYIHDELMESNYLSPVQAIRFFQRRAVGGLKFLLDNADLSHITVVCNVGNHGRTTPKMRISTSSANSFEWLAYHNIADHFSDDKRITFQIAEGYHSLLTIQNHRFRFHHGEAIKYEGGVGGITIPINKAIAQWNKSIPADYDVFGHWHQFLRMWRYIGNGCLIGYTAHAQKIKADFQPPSQSFLVCDRDRGLVFAEPVFVE